MVEHPSSTPLNFNNIQIRRRLVFFKYASFQSKKVLASVLLHIQFAQSQEGSNKLIRKGSLLITSNTFAQLVLTWEGYNKSKLEPQLSRILDVIVTPQVQSFYGVQEGKIWGSSLYEEASHTHTHIHIYIYIYIQIRLIKRTQTYFILLYCQENDLSL